jgi:ATP-dependent Clp protease ATP-binding subunit ClpA
MGTLRSKIGGFCEDFGGLRSGHKEHHKCDITTEAVETAGYLSPQYIPD